MLSTVLTKRAYRQRDSFSIFALQIAYQLGLFLKLTQLPQHVYTLALALYDFIQLLNQVIPLFNFFKKLIIWLLEWGMYLISLYFSSFIQMLTAYYQVKVFSY